MNNFCPGYDGPVKFQATGQGAVSELNVTGWQFSEEVARAIVTHTGHQGLQARLATVRDGKGSFSADLDLDAIPNLNPPSIIPGVSGVMYFFASETLNKFIQVPVMITEVPYTSQVQGDGKVSYSCNVEVNSIAGQMVRLV